MVYPVARRLLLLVAISAMALAACSFIPKTVTKTVSGYVSGNILFPKEAVREVFEGMETTPTLLNQAPPPAGPRSSSAIGETPKLRPTASPECPKVPRWWPIGVACAQETSRPSLPPDPKQALLEELSLMVEAREALQSRNDRRPFIQDWKKKELIGEANDGRIVFLIDRREVDRDILARVSNENDDRRILMRAMAKAVVAINGIEPAEKLIKTQIPATRREFAAVRRRLSPTGTWVQLPDGQWVKK